jgi:hypothetical protein
MDRLRSFTRIDEAFTRGAGNYAYDRLHPVNYPLRVFSDAKKPGHRKEAGKTMIAWEKMAANELAPQKPATAGSGSLVYRLMVAFPAWAGALVTCYAIFPRLGVAVLNIFRIRPR